MATELASKIEELEPDASWLFGCIASRDINERTQALQQLETWVNEVIVVFQSESNRDESTEEEEEEDQVNKDCSQINSEDWQTPLRHILLQVLRLSIQCPFEDVKSKCSDLLVSLKDKGIQVPRQCGRGSSSFIPSEELIPVSNGPDELDLRDVFIEVFIQNQRLDNLSSVLGLHPRYLSAFQQTQEFMMKKDGPLPFEYRHYLAIMAAARHRCSYLVKLQENEFRNQGGDPKWLESIDNIPIKLQNLYELIKCVAHQPWHVDMNMIEPLLQPPNSWSLSELVQAVVIVSHFCSLPCLVYGSGINLEVDMEGGYTMESPTQSEDVSPSMTNNNHTPEELEGASADVETLMKRMKQLTEQSDAEDSQEEHIKQFEKVERQSLELAPKGEEQSCADKCDLSNYLRDPDFKYKDFAKRGVESKLPTFRAQDYSWEEHGFSLVNRYYPDMASLIDEKLSLTSNLTYNTMGQKTEVDTSLLRRAIWNYVHALFGIRHDDYDYAEVNLLLDRSLKSYIKLICCFPEKTTYKDYSHFWKDFADSEKVHVNLMVLEARMQACLLYVLRAIMEYMK